MSDDRYPDAVSAEQLRELANGGRRPPSPEPGRQPPVPPPATQLGRIRDAQVERALRCRHCVSEVVIVLREISGIRALDVAVIHAAGCPWRAAELERQGERFGWLIEDGEPA